MSNVKFVRPRVAVVRHPLTAKALPPEGELVDMTDITVRIFFLRRETEGDVQIAESADGSEWRVASTDSSAPTSGSADAKPRKGADK